MRQALAEVLDQRVAQHLLDRAIGRNELPPLDPDIAVNLVFGPIFHRFMVDSGSLTPEVVDYLIPMTVAALKAAPSRSSRPTVETLRTRP